MTQAPHPATYPQIFRFWLPLAATWLMMAVEGPFIAAIIARMGAEAVNLAAYGVAFAFALVAEAPVIMLLSSATALCRDRISYRRLRHFSIGLSLAVTLGLALFLLPPVYDLIVRSLIGLPPEVADLTRTALFFLLPWPGAIGLRRFYQGVLIASHNTRLVALATIFRISFMGATAVFCYLTTSVSGAIIGALALTSGVVAEALMTRILAHKAVKALLAKDPPEGTCSPGYRDIWDHYLPLALTPLIGLSVHPMVTFFLSRAANPVESLAVMPVIYGLTFVFRAVGLSYQEIAIALLSEQCTNYPKVRGFAVILAIATGGCLTLIAFTPLNRFWFETVSGLTPALATFAATPLQLMALFPALTVLICFQRSILIVTRVTRPVSIATAAEATVIFLLMFIALLYLPLAGATAAAGAYVGGRLVAVVLLQRPVGRQLTKEYYG
ncbi:MAG: hypothetical protein K0A94_08650 [Desulfuromonadales bacterium]|nr:hypothetical protein [Desulfuromonadales bacterium]